MRVNLLGFSSIYPEDPFRINREYDISEVIMIIVIFITSQAFVVRIP